MSKENQPMRQIPIVYQDWGKLNRGALGSWVAAVKWFSWGKMADAVTYTIEECGCAHVGWWSVWRTSVLAAPFRAPVLGTEVLNDEVLIVRTGVDREEENTRCWESPNLCSCGLLSIFSHYGQVSSYCLFLYTSNSSSERIPELWPRDSALWFSLPAVPALASLQPKTRADHLQCW